MLRGVTLLAGAVLLSGCALSVPDDALTVSEAKERLHAWDGRDVKIHGWLGECWGNDCPVYQTRDFAVAGSGGDWESSEFRRARDNSINMYIDVEFQRNATWMEFDRVVVTGKLDASCTNPDGSPSGCFDGADFQAQTIKKLLF